MRSQAIDCPTSCVATSTARPSAASVSIRRVSRSALGASSPVKGSSKRTMSASWSRRTRDQYPLPLASGELSERRLRRLAEADAVERVERARPVGGSRAPPPRPATDDAHQHDVERGDRIVEPGAFGLWHRAAASVDDEEPAPRRELAQQRADQRRLAAAVGAEDADALAALDGERHALEDHRPAAVAGGEVSRLGLEAADRASLPIPREALDHRVGVGRFHLQVRVAAGALRAERVPVQDVVRLGARSRARASSPAPG